jgi:nitroreductase
MDILEELKKRRSVREFTDEEIPREDREKILEAARWAPSGLNNQPWKFLLIREKKKRELLSGFTKYSAVIENASLCICVFLDKDKMYNREKDLMSIGAAVQNMLLEASSLGIGTCWLGEILNRKKEVCEALNLPGRYELTAVVAAGIPAEKVRRGEREKIDDLLLEND